MITREAPSKFFTKILTTKNKVKAITINGRIYFTPSFSLPLFISPRTKEPRITEVTKKATEYCMTNTWSNVGTVDILKGRLTPGVFGIATLVRISVKTPIK